MRIESPDVLVERVDEHPERQVPVELRCRSAQHQVAPGLGARSKLGKQAGLADARLTHQRERSSVAPPDLGQPTIQRTEHSGASDELLREHRDALLASRNQGGPPMSLSAPQITVSAWPRMCSTTATRRTSAG